MLCAIINKDNEEYLIYIKEVNAVRKKIPFILAAVTVTCFIFGNSVQSIEVSSAQSDRIVGIIADLFVRIGIGFDAGALTYIVRKLAHVTEFMLQGIMLANCFNMAYRKRIIYILFLGLFTACTDEYIQVFSDRGSMVQDVFIDFFGTILGTVLVGISYKVRRR